jgi:NCAIR mutase (PurE)-related protein
MDEARLRALLEALSRGELSVGDVVDGLKALPYEAIGDFARLDHHRSLRKGFPEAIFAQNKTPDQLVQIFNHMAERSDCVLATRVSAEMYAAVKDQISEAVYQPVAHLLYLDRNPDRERRPGVLVLSAGTADIPVAEEAAITADLMGSQVERLFDVGVSGLHRLLDQAPVLQRARVVVVVAGMEGALPSVVGGLVAAPVIAVPSSVGYGASLGGITALLAMLNSCANGVAVVNIDNGFGAGYMAGLINRMQPISRKESRNGSKPGKHTVRSRPASNQFV